MLESRKTEVERNFQAFQHIVGGLLPDHQGEYALMHKEACVGLFDSLLDAVAAGQARFDDRMFSIQEVTVTPLDLGFYSHANPSGSIC